MFGNVSTTVTYRIPAEPAPAGAPGQQPAEHPDYEQARETSTSAQRKPARQAHVRDCGTTHFTAGTGQKPPARKALESTRVRGL